MVAVRAQVDPSAVGSDFRPVRFRGIARVNGGRGLSVGDIEALAVGVPSPTWRFEVQVQYRGRSGGVIERVLRNRVGVLAGIALPVAQRRSILAQPYSDVFAARSPVVDIVIVRNGSGLIVLSNDINSDKIVLSCGVNVQDDVAGDGRRAGTALQVQSVVCTVAGIHDDVVRLDLEIRRSVQKDSIPVVVANGRINPVVGEESSRLGVVRINSVLVVEESVVLNRCSLLHRAQVDSVRSFSASLNHVGRNQDGLCADRRDAAPQVARDGIKGNGRAGGGSA